MSAGLEHIRRNMADYLKEQGICALTAWPANPRLDTDMDTRRNIVKLRDINAICVKTGGVNLTGKLPRDDQI